MIKRYNNLSFAFFIPGIILQITASVLLEKQSPPSLLAVFLLAIGSALSITGFAFYAKAKGQSPIFGVVGLAGVIGLVILALLKDKSGDPWNT